MLCSFKLKIAINSALTKSPETYKSKNYELCIFIYTVRDQRKRVWII